MIGATIKTSGYRVLAADGRTIAIIGRGLDSSAMIREAIAEEVRCDPDALEFEEEYDAHGWTGEEIVKIDGFVVARVLYPND